MPKRNSWKSVSYEVNRTHVQILLTSPIVDWGSQNFSQYEHHVRQSVREALCGLHIKRGLGNIIKLYS